MTHLAWELTQHLNRDHWKESFKCDVAGCNFVRSSLTTYLLLIQTPQENGDRHAVKRHKAETHEGADKDTVEPEGVDHLGLALDAGVPLDLGLVGGVHGEPQEEAPDDDAPDGVSLSHVLPRPI